MALILTSCRTLKHKEELHTKDTASTNVSASSVVQAHRDTSVTRTDTISTRTMVDTSKASNVTETTVLERIYPDSTIRVTHTRSTSSIAQGISDQSTDHGTSTQVTGAATTTEIQAREMAQATAKYVDSKEATSRTVPMSRNVWSIIILLVVGIIIYTLYRYRL